jgi:hypothetical protein
LKKKPKPVAAEEADEEAGAVEVEEAAGAGAAEEAEAAVVCAEAKVVADAVKSVDCPTMPGYVGCHNCNLLWNELMATEQLYNALRSRDQQREDLSPNSATIENAQGGKQSFIRYAFHLLPPQAMLDVAQVFYTGAQKYEANNWRKIPAEEHINHCLTHLFAYLAGDNQDTHLENAGARILMALELGKEAR